MLKEIDELIKYCRIDNRQNIACEVLIRDSLSPKILLRDKKINRIAFLHIINSIKSRYRYALTEGGDMVGPLAAQSLGERTTQMTLNSVDWETEIVIAKNGELLLPKIGEFIDNYYEECLADPAKASKIQYIKCPNKDDQIYIPLDDGNDWRAYSCDEDGNVIWTKLEAITRHPVVNEDSSETILEVELECGRTVKATKGRSFLVYDEATNKIIDKNGSDLQIDDLIPVCEGLELDLDNTDTETSTPYFKEITHLNIKKYLSPSEYIYKDEIDKALEVMTTENAKGNRHWFKHNQGSVFTVPYKRSDTFRDSICPKEGQVIRGKDKNGDIKEHPMNGIYNKLQLGCVYPLSMRSCKSNIPANIPLTNEFGYFIGAYLADGMCNDLRIIISKEDKDFIAPIKELMTSWGIGYRYVRSVKKEANTETGQSEWVSNDHIFQSTLLADLLGKVFGKTSEDKAIPVWILQTPKEFLKGMISGYFSGDGCVSLDGSISAGSVGKKMLEIIGLILNRFNVSWTIHKTKQDREKFPIAKEYIYNIRIPKEYNSKFAQHFKFTIKGKAARLLEYNSNENENRRILRIKHLNTVILRKVKNISEVLPTEKEYNKIKKRWVYDLTVEKTLNFTTSSLMCLVDTFHLSGVAEKSTVTQGVPRLTELLSNTKNPKNSYCEIYLDEEHRFNREMAEKVANNVELVTIGDVLESSAIYLEPNNDFNNVLPEDREFLEIYRIFSEIDSQAMQIPNNPWMIRLEFDRRKIIDKKITMEDISLILKSNYPQASLMFMDDNASKLVFRMRLTFQSNLNKANDDIVYLEAQINEISNIVIKGVDYITRVFLNADENTQSQVIVKENGSFVSKKEFTISTEGSNLFDILMRKGIDTSRTYSIDPNEMYAIFGIEAARFQIQYQLNQVLLTSSVKLSPRHLDLLCDKMCQNGDIMSVSRHGIKKENIGPLAKASFEETTDQLLEASLFGEFDSIKGVSSNIMVGQIPTCGTGDSTILIDEDLLNTQEDLIEKEEVDINTYFKSSEYCESSEIKFSLGDVNPNDGEYDDYPDVMVE
jgi:DNA-directed RNA polymerase beta' subunit